MKTTIKFLGMLALASLSFASCRYTHAEPNDSTEESATQTMTEGQGGNTETDTASARNSNATIEQDSTESSNPQGNVAPREENGAGNNAK